MRSLLNLLKAHWYLYPLLPSVASSSTPNSELASIGKPFPYESSSEIYPRTSQGKSNLVHYLPMVREFLVWSMGSLERPTSPSLKLCLLLQLLSSTSLCLAKGIRPWQAVEKPRFRVTLSKAKGLKTLQKWDSSLRPVHRAVQGYAQNDILCIFWLFQQSVETWNNLMNVVLVRHGKGDNLNDNTHRGHFYRNRHSKKSKIRDNSLLGLQSF